MGSTSRVKTRDILVVLDGVLQLLFADSLNGKQCRSIAVGSRIVLCRIRPCCGAHEDKQQAWAP